MLHSPTSHLRWPHYSLLMIAAAGTPLGAVANSDEASEAVVVLDQRDVRDQSMVQGKTLREAPAGSGPLKLMNALPGVAWTGSDNLGSYEWGNDLSVRGFGLNQIGFALDNIPLGSTHFWYSTGIDPSRVIAAENLRSITLTPGSGSLEAASYHALGASVQLASSSPEKTFGLRFKESLGSYRNQRSFLRVDSGELASGLSSYLSVSSSIADKWKGMASPGQQMFGMFDRDPGAAITGAGARWGNYHDQINLKLVQPIGEHRLSFFYAYADKRENDYADLTLPVLQARGYRFDNYTAWQDAKRDTAEDAYFGSSMSYRRDHLAALTGDFLLGEQATLKVTPYMQHDWGYGDWHIPSSDEGGMTDIQYRRSQVQSERKGINSHLNVQLGQHQLEFGAWLEQSRYSRQRALYDLVDWRLSPTVKLDSPVSTLLNRTYDTSARQFFAKDDIALNAQWLLSLGAKASHVHTEFNDLLGRYPSNTLSSRRNFLPQIGLTYRLNPADELFSYYVENSGALPITAFTTRAFNADIKPERTQTLEAGWRHHDQQSTASLSLYAINYRDRLLQINNCSLLGTCPSLIANVGAVHKKGAEASVQWRWPSHWSASGSLSYDHSRYADDYVSQGKTVATAGKTPVNSPSWLAAWEVRHEQGQGFAALKGKFTDQRYASYSNDLVVPSTTLWSLVAGYRCQPCLGLQRVESQLSVENLTNRHRIATIGQSGFSAYDPSGANTYVQVGAPRMLFLSISGAFQ